ncbi:phage holin family protein [Aestuariibacter sp. A3R04]|uniref:phage holin family protein n=1 Tax=Aestuariibacter sp. A3R04 TaxID=2841571 RepID=UPI001C089D22|nr:phage holin family protein [Aestuariibacter sp. A3R04]MBU3023225.1 phage holin family protein [Aestuariibacter sp. A3R04]
MATAPHQQKTDRPASDKTDGPSAGDDSPYRHLNTTVDETLSSLRWLAMEKQQEYLSLLELVSAEVRLAKKSALVTILATLTAFVFSCFCWLVINLFMAIGLHKLDMHFALISLIVFSINALFAVLGFTMAKKTYRRISLMPACRILLSAVGLSSQQGE